MNLILKWYLPNMYTRWFRLQQPCGFIIHDRLLRFWELAKPTDEPSDRCETTHLLQWFQSPHAHANCAFNCAFWDSGLRRKWEWWLDIIKINSRMIKRPWDDRLTYRSSIITTPPWPHYYRKNKTPWTEEVLWKDKGPYVHDLHTSSVIHIVSFTGGLSWEWQPHQESW